MKKKILYGMSFLSLCLIATGCGSDANKSLDSKEEREENYENKVVCEYVNGDGRYVLYFDDNDIIKSFDAYETKDIAGTNYDDDAMKEMKKAVCAGEGEFKKEWIKECDMKKDGTKYTLHVYIDSNEWFDDLKEKDKLLDYVKENGIDGEDVVCK